VDGSWFVARSKKMSVGKKEFSTPKKQGIFYKL
jgi:hypothetical protein